MTSFTRYAAVWRNLLLIAFVVLAGLVVVLLSQSRIASVGTLIAFF